MTGRAPKPEKIDHLICQFNFYEMLATSHRMWDNFRVVCATKLKLINTRI